MFPLSRTALQFATAAAFLGLTAVSTPTFADDAIQNLGPVKPHEPMIATIGSKRIIAFYIPGNEGCHVQAVIWADHDAEGKTATGFRVRLNPSQTVSVDSGENKSLTLQCGAYAETLAIVDVDRQVASK